MPRKKKLDKEWPPIRFHKQSNSWLVDVGTKISQPDPKTGVKERIRKYFKSKQEAEVCAEQYRIKRKNQGLSAFTLSRDEQFDAERALKILKPTGVSLEEAAAFFAEYHELKGAEMTFGGLVDDYRDMLEAKRAKGEGVADRTYSDYKSRHNKLKDQFEDIKLISFSHLKHWEPFSRTLGKSSRRYENHIRILFNYAVQRDYLKTSPMIGKLSDAKALTKPSILKEEQWRQLILTAVETDKELDLLAYVVLTLYMGLRPESEVKRIGWQNINFKTGKLFIGDDETGKSDLGRTLQIPECAIALLNRCKRKKGKIIEVDYEFRKNWLKLRELAGFIFKDSKGEVIRNEWIADIARHTAGTMVYAKTQSKEAVRSFLGHTNPVTMRYYVNHSESLDEEAERFYSFKVEKSTKRKPQIKVA